MASAARIEDLMRGGRFSRPADLHPIHLALKIPIDFFMYEWLRVVDPAHRIEDYDDAANGRVYTQSAFDSDQIDIDQVALRLQQLRNQEMRAGPRGPANVARWLIKGLRRFHAAEPPFGDPEDPMPSRRRAEGDPST